MYNNNDVIIFRYEPSTNFNTYMESDQKRKDRISEYIAAMYYTIFTQNILHGDVHDSNWGINDDNKIVIYDFGFVVKINKPLLLMLNKALKSCDIMAFLLILYYENSSMYDSNLNKLNNYVFKLEDFDTDYSKIVGQVIKLMHIFCKLGIPLDSDIMVLNTVTLILDRYINEFSLNYDPEYNKKRPCYIHNISHIYDKILPESDEITEIINDQIDYINNFEEISTIINDYDINIEKRKYIQSLINYLLISNDINEYQAIDIIIYLIDKMNMNNKVFEDINFAKFINFTSLCKNRICPNIRMNCINNLENIINEYIYNA